MTDVIRLKQHYYIHVLDNNTNVTKCIVGPAVYTRKDQEKVLFQPRACVLVPPRSYCRVRNPCVVDAGTKQALLDEFGQVRLRIGEVEIRFEQEPFPLMPGESLVDDEPIKKLAVVPAGAALRLRCERDFKDGEVSRRPGDEWLFEGPDTYIPRVEVEVLRTVKATVIKPNSALRLRATREFTDRTGAKRLLGEEWLVTAVGAYLPAVEEEVVGPIDARVLTDRDGLHLEAIRSFTDAFGKKREAGERWLITNRNAATHIPHVYERVLADVKVTTLDNRQFCVVMDPVDRKSVV